MYTSSKPYPYLPAGRTIAYVPADDRFMRRAQELCVSHTRYCRVPTAAVLVRDGRVIGEGRNGGEDPPAICVRKERGIPTGQQYELCPGCDPRNHAEPSAIRNAGGEPTKGADLYLFGHWWCCEPCWNAMIAAGIRNVYLVESATERFSG